MFHTDSQLIRHILDEIEFIENETKLLTVEQFLLDPKSQRAFARSIEIIGEAVKNLSRELVNIHMEIEWRKIAGMRDRLIHGYFSVNNRLVWDVATTTIPAFRIKLQSILKEIE